MTTRATENVLRHLHSLATAQEVHDLPDDQLLQRFTAISDDAACTELMRRHGPLVLSVCRRVLHREQDVEDAFQATFLILARKAASIDRHASVACWLHRVAHHAALRARASTARAGRDEEHSTERAPADPLAEVSGRELLAVVDAELQQLPDPVRAPLVLCYLEGKTRDAAARVLGWSLATLKRRLGEGRTLLRERLTRRGLGLPAALLLAGL